MGEAVEHPRLALVAAQFPSFYVKHAPWGIHSLMTWVAAYGIGWRVGQEGAMPVDILTLGTISIIISHPITLMFMLVDGPTCNTSWFVVEALTA